MRFRRTRSPRRFTSGEAAGRGRRGRCGIDVLPQSSRGRILRPRQHRAARCGDLLLRPRDVRAQVLPGEGHRTVRVPAGAVPDRRGGSRPRRQRPVRGAVVHRQPLGRRTEGPRGRDLRGGHPEEESGQAPEPSRRAISTKANGSGSSPPRRSSSQRSSPRSSDSPARSGQWLNTSTVPTPGGWSATCCTGRPRPTQCVPWPSERVSSSGGAPPTATLRTTSRCCPSSAFPAPSTPTPGCARYAKERGWQVRDYRARRRNTAIGVAAGAGAVVGAIVGLALARRTRR